MHPKGYVGSKKRTPTKALPTAFFNRACYTREKLPKGADCVGGIFGGEEASVQVWDNDPGSITDNTFAGKVSATGSATSESGSQGIVALAALAVAAVVLIKNWYKFHKRVTVYGSELHSNINGGNG